MISESAEVFDFLTYDEVMNEPPKEFLVQGLLGQKDIAMIYGPGKVGKSLVVLDLIGALIRGCDFASRFAIRRAIPVVYATGEGQSGLPNRLQALHRKWEHTPEERERLKIVKQVPQLYKIDGKSSIRNFVTRFTTLFGAMALSGGLLVVDTWARAVGGADENTSKDTTDILNALAESSTQLDCTVLAVHHANKGGDIRGSSNIQAGFDNVIHVRHASDGTRYMGCAIAKDAEVTEDLTFFIDSIEWGDGMGQVHKGGTIRWGEKLDPKLSRAIRLEKEFRSILQSEGYGEDAALTIAQVTSRLSIDASPTHLRETADRLVGSPESGVQVLHKQTTDKNDRAGRRTAHYYLSTDNLN